MKILKIKNLCGWCFVENNSEYDVKQYLAHGNMCTGCASIVNRRMGKGKESITQDRADTLMAAERKLNNSNKLCIKLVEVEDNQLIQLVEVEDDQLIKIKI